MSNNNDNEMLKILQQRGRIPPSDDGFLTESAEAVGYQALRGMHVVSKTLEHYLPTESITDFFSGQVKSHRHWEAPEGYSALSLKPSHLGRTLFGGAVSMAPTLIATAVGTAAGGPVSGVAAGVGTTYAMLFGDTYEEYRAAMPDVDEWKVRALANFSALGQAAIEQFLGPEKLLSGLGKGVAKEAAQKTYLEVIKRYGTAAAKNAFSEGGEEVMQLYYNELVKACGTHKIDAPSFEEVAETFAAGAIPGGVFGGAIEGRRNRPTYTNIENVSPTIDTNIETPTVEQNIPVPTPELENTQTVFEDLQSVVAENFGINLQFMDTLPNAQELQEEGNGFFDEETNTIYMDRQTFNSNPMETFGHELKHYIDKNMPELSKIFDNLVKDSLTDNGKQEFQQFLQDLGYDQEKGTVDFNAEMFGRMLSRPDTWQKTAVALEEKSSGMGAKFLQLLKRFLSLFKQRLGNMFAEDPSVESMFKEVSALENEASRILVELHKRKQGAESQLKADETIAKGADGSVRLPEVVAVDDILVDPERFQFKEDRNKSGVVNPLGGKFQQEVARPLYIWEDKDGKRYVVEGHHRLDLAKRSGTKEVLAYIHKESEGETADFARRRGVLMNIQDNKGTVRDFASFFREDKISYEEAVERGLFREKEPEPKQGFMIGRYANDLLYSAFRNGEISADKAAVIAEVARGDEALEAAGVRSAKSMSKAQLTEFMRLLKESPRKKSDAQGDLFGFDDSAIQTAETLAKLAVKHIKEVHESVLAAERAIKNPEAAKKLKVSVGKGAETLYKKALIEEERWQNWHTDPELYNQLLQEAGLVEQTQEPVVKDNLTTESENVFLDSTEKITDEDFSNPTRSITLPALPDAVLNAIGKKSKPVLLKKNILEKNRNHHKELSADDSRKILDRALYHSERVIQDKPSDKPNYWVMAKLDDKSSIVTIEISENKENYEIVGWRFASAKSIQQIKNRAIREGGQVLVTESNTQGSSGLHDLSYGSDVNIPKKQEKSSTQNEKTDVLYRPEVGENFDDFYKRFAPQLDAIIADFRKSFPDLAGKYEGDWRSAAGTALVKAYQKYDPTGGAKIDTYASTVVENAITSELRTESRIEQKESISLDTELDSGDTLGDIVAAEDKEIKDTPKEAYRKIMTWAKANNNKRIARIAKMRFVEGKNFSDIARSEGIGLKTAENAKKALLKAADKAGVLWQKKRKLKQLNPVVQDGVVKEEYQYLLDSKEEKVTPEKIADWDNQAVEWIVQQGGILPAMQKINKGTVPGRRHVAELVRRHIINSDVYRDHTTYESRVKLAEVEINARRSWGKEGRAMQMSALDLTKLENVQAFFNMLQKDMPDEARIKLRNQIMKRTGVDIHKLDKAVVEDRRKLDQVLREAVSSNAKFSDKLFEYWINGLLSWPGTHVRNTLGNMANIIYETSIKRFAEATINKVIGRKTGASFKDFKAMMNVVNWSDMRRVAGDAWHLEVLNPETGFADVSHVSIGGKHGRVVRVPGRSLKVADAVAKAFVQPMEASVMANRLANEKGLSGKARVEFVEAQLENPNSRSNQWGRQRALEMMFQEDPGSAVKMLMAWGANDGVSGKILNYFFPFKKTPANIVRQTVRKSPLGIVNPNLWKNTYKGVKGDKAAADQAVALFAEQLIAWSVMGWIFSSVGGDDEDLPLITGTSPAYGSAEANFKRNKVPAYSIRIGDKYYSYKALEPFAGGLAMMVDAAKSVKRAGDSKEGSSFVKDMWNTSRQVIAEKSFFESLNQINKLVMEPDNEKDFARWGTSFISSWVPNVVRKTLTLREDHVSDTKSRNYGDEFWNDQFNVIMDKAGFSKMAPKIDYFGRPVKIDALSESSFAWFLRPLSIDVQPAGDMDKVERLIWDYNKKNPDKEYYPNIPQSTFTYKKQRCYFSGKDYQDYATQAGQLAHKQLMRAVDNGYINANNPTEKDIEKIKKIFSKSREQVRNDFIRQNRYKKR